MLLSPTPIAAAGIPARPLRSGHGSMAISRIRGRSVVTSACSASPLRLLIPRSSGPSVWVYASSFGGGLVAGDSIDLEVQADPGTTTFLSTQSATKVYKALDGQGCRQSATVSAGADSILVWLPDPVCCFASARYEQRQRFDLAPGASLFFLDAVTCGRGARGERWAFDRYASRTDILLDSRLLLRDAIVLDPEDGPIDAPHRMGRFDCMATLLLLGPALIPAAQAILEELKAQPVSRAPSLLAGASPVGDGVLLRVLGPSAQAVAHHLRARLPCLRTLLGDDPLARKW